MAVAVKRRGPVTRERLTGAGAGASGFWALSGSTSEMANSPIGRREAFEVIGDGHAVAASDLVLGRFADVLAASARAAATRRRAQLTSDLTDGAPRPAEIEAAALT